MSDTELPPSLAPAEARQLDQTCDHFEEAWKHGERPHPEAFLGTVGEPVRSALLRQLLLLDWDYRRRAGENPTAGDYHPRFPDDPALVEDVSREMAEPAASTCWGSDEPARNTLCSGDRAPGVAGEAAAEAGPARYDLLQEVGHGGIGVVFRCRDRLLGRDVAVKVLRESYRDNPDAQRRFAEEARVSSQLQHPAIVPVYELGTFGGRRPYITMKLVEGHTLAALLQGRADPGQDVARLLGIFDQVCQAVAYAHARGIVHRDLKPANVMVGTFGEVQVMDWGFAKQLQLADYALQLEHDGDSSGAPRPLPAIGNLAGATQSGALMGTPAYMPPEQARGEVALIDPRADVFALGAILCEILTGRPPYAGGTADDVCRKAAAADLGEVHARLDACGADEALRKLARRCLTAERSARPPNAGVVAQDLTAYLASAQERLQQAQLERAAAEARAQEARAKAKGERRAWRLILALAAVVVLALVAGIVGITWGLVEAEQARKDEADQRRTAVTNAEQARTARDEAWRLANEEKAARHRAETVLYLGHVTEAHNHFLNHDLARCQLALGECREDLRGPEYGYLVNQLAKKARALPGQGGLVPTLALSEDGKRLASGGRDGTIKVWDPDAGKEALTLSGHKEAITGLAVSGDGKRLVSGSLDSTVKVWDLDAGKEALALPALSGHGASVTSLALSGDHKRLFLGYRQDGTVRVWDLEANQQTLTLRGHTAPVTGLALSGDGKRLVSMSSDGPIKVWVLEAGE